MTRPAGSSIRAATRLYSFASIASTTQHRVDNETFGQFCRALQTWTKVVGESSEDEYWTDFRISLRTFKYVVSAAPLSFSSPELGAAGTADRLAARYALVGNSFPGAAAIASELVMLLARLSICPDNPLLDTLASLLAAGHSTTRTVLVVRDTRLIAPTEAALSVRQETATLEVVSPIQLAAGRSYDRIVLMGNADAFPDYVLTAPRAPRLDVIVFSWQARSRLNTRRLFAAASAPANQSAARRSSKDVPVSTEASVTNAGTNEDLDPVSVVPPDSWIAGAGAGNRPNRAGDGDDIVCALPVTLDGGLAVLLDGEDGASALAIDLQEPGRRRVRRVQVTDLEPRMFVLLRAGGGGDLIVPVADALLGDRAAECRQMQREWKDALREAVQQNGLLEVSVALIDQGSQLANEANVRRWMWARSIRPQHYDDFRAIMRLASREASAEAYWAAMTLIDKAHAKAGQRIRRLLLREVHATDLTALERLGTMEFELPGVHTGALVAHRVLSIAAQPVLAPHSRINHVFETLVPLWQE